MGEWVEEAIEILLTSHLIVKSPTLPPPPRTLFGATAGGASSVFTIAVTIKEYNVSESCLYQ